jgi:hypothetical protein
VYGLLGLTAVAIWFAGRGSSDAREPAWFILSGHTERGNGIELVFRGGKLFSVDTRTSMWCPATRGWQDGIWQPVDGPRAVRFRHEGRRFDVRQRGLANASRGRVRLNYAMRGELAEDERKATGTITAAGRFGGAKKALACRGTVRFRATRRE